MFNKILIVKINYNMTISVCIITLNEEKVIKRLLNCVKKFADEIILVDTGSVDKTVEIAKEFTDKIYYFKWVDDFSKARNFAFSKAKCDYLFWIDADDVITDENVYKILKIKSQSNVLVDVYMFKYSCGFDNNQKPSLTFYRERLIRNCSLAKFQGFVHETVSPFGNICYENVEVEHRKQRASNPKRNLNLYKKHLPISNFSQRDVYYFAKEYFYLGYYKTAIKLLKTYLNMKNKNLPDQKDALVTLSICYKSLKMKGYEKFLFTALKVVGVDNQILCLIGDYFMDNDDLINAEKYYKICLCLQKNDNIGFCYNQFYYIYPLLQLTFLNYKKGNLRQSFYYHKLCKKDSPNDIRVIENDNFFAKLQKNK